MLDFLSFKTLSRFLCGLLGLLFFAAGLICFAQPETAAEWLNYDFLSEGGLSEFVTVYGGLYLGIGAYVAWGAIAASYHKSIFLFLALSSTLAAFARLYSFVLLSPAVGWVYPLAVGEIALSLLGWTAFVVAVRNEMLKDETRQDEPAENSPVATPESEAGGA